MPKLLSYSELAEPLFYYKINSLITKTTEAFHLQYCNQGLHWYFFNIHFKQKKRPKGKKNVEI